ncbi:MAG: carbamoyltransferase family protein [Gemmatimonadaceae bacterium]
MPPTYILGISAFYHDSAACLVRDGVIVAAAQEERFTRVKGDERFPGNAAAFCLRSAGIAASDLAAVAFYDKPLLKLDRLLETYLWLAPRGLRSFLKAGPLWGKSRLFLEREIRQGLDDYDGTLLWCEHHESHAASAFFPSPFPEAAVLTMDGVGEWATASIGVGRGSSLQLTHELHWPDSLGLLYSAFTYHAGFRVNSGEYKLMGLAPYGEPRYASAIRDHLVDLREDGSFTLDQRYFDYLGGLTMTNDAFSALFGGPPRAPEGPLTQREMDLARSVQEVTEEVVLRMARTARRTTGCGDLCLAGGVALNAVANGRLLRERVVDRLWIQPAAGDAGGALGAALLAWHRWSGGAREADGVHDAMRGALLGPTFAPDEVEAALVAEGARFERLGDDGVVARAAELLAEGRVVGWFDGPMEFGPRALGARSILADPRDARMQATLNLKIKFREGFRPFAPSVLAERATEYFEMDAESPYMLLVVPVQPARRLAPEAAPGEQWGIDRLNVPRSDIPAVTHLDHSARVQTVTAERAPGLHAVLSAFEALTGCAVLVNTSFNVRGEPVVCSPADAYACLMGTNMDYLAIPPFLVERAAQPGVTEARWQRPIPLD